MPGERWCARSTRIRGWAVGRRIFCLDEPFLDVCDVGDSFPNELISLVRMGSFYSGRLLSSLLWQWLVGSAGRRGFLKVVPLAGGRFLCSTSLQLTRLVGRITRNFGEKRLTGAVFLDVAKAFDTVWIDGLLYKLTLFNFPSYIVNTISSYLRDRTFEASFQTVTSSRRGLQAGVAQGRLISTVLFSLYVNDMPPPSHHAELALYADDTVIIATSRKPTLLVS